MLRLTLIISFLFSPLTLFAYEPTTTHAGLTEQIVSFYNHGASPLITEDDKEKIVSGAIAEDSGLRYFNHLYDPTRNAGYNNYRSAKSWAFDTTGLNGYAWQDGIQAYAEGRNADAMISLGHILHLIEDMAVPEHTRNDGHGIETLVHESPYEKWAHENKNRTTLAGLSNTLISEGVTVRHLPTFEELFDFMARYSNGNFFSADTIDNKIISYANPVKTRTDGDYVYGVDSLTNKEVKLLVKDKTEYGQTFSAMFTQNDKSILSSYFDRLSRQVIPAGAGVVEFFVKEGEKARAIFLAEEQRKKEMVIEKATSRAQVLASAWLGTGWVFKSVFAVTDTVTGVVSFGLDTTGTLVGWVVTGVSSGTRLAVDVGKLGGTSIGVGAATSALWAYDTGTDAVSTVLAEGKVFIQKTLKEDKLDGKAQAAGLVAFVVEPVDSASVSTSVASVESVPVSVASSADTPRLIFVGAQPLSPGFGGGAPAPKPPETTTVLAFVDSTGLVPPAEQSSSETEETAPETPVVAPESEETERDASVAVPEKPTIPDAPIIDAPQCTFSLATDGCLLATTSIHFEWAPIAGAHYYHLSKNGIFATTTETTIDVMAKDFSDYTLEVATVSVSEAGGLVTTSATSTKTVSVATIPVAINEVAWAGTLASATDEWLELKNNTAHAIDLSNWALVAGDDKPYVKLAGTIAPRAYIIFERTNDGVVKDVVAQGVYKGALDNDGEELFLSYASSTLDKTPAIVGKKWAGGENSSTTKKTMERYVSKEPGADASNWGTNLDFMQNGTDADGGAIEGTPGARNSVSYLINKGEDITEDTTLRADEGPYIVRDGEEVRVHASSTFTIEAGNTISFQEGDSATYRDHAWRRKSIFVEGRLDVQGTEENPVTINALSPPRGSFLFDELRFSGGAGTSTINHANIEGIEGILLEDGARVEIRNSEVVGTGTGITVRNGSSIVLNNDRIASTTHGALMLIKGSSGVVASTTIENILSGDGISAYGDNQHRESIKSGSFLQVSSTTIRNISDGDGIGLYSSTAIIDSTTIENIADGSGLGVYHSVLDVASTTIRGIASDDGAIELYSSTSTLSHIVLENGNGEGLEVYKGQVDVDDMVVSGFQETGILIATTDATITNTETKENGVGVVFLSKPAFSDILAHDNTVNVSDTMVDLAVE